MAGSDQAGLLHRLDRGGPVGVRLNPKRNILAAWTIEERPIRHDLAAQHRGIELGIGPLSQYRGNGFVNMAIINIFPGPPLYLDQFFHPVALSSEELTLG